LKVEASLGSYLAEKKRTMDLHLSFFPARADAALESITEGGKSSDGLQPKTHGSESGRNEGCDIPNTRVFVAREKKRRED
jgi:hypothetical protein